MLADIVDEQELATGKRKEGVVFAVAFFSSKFTGAFGYVIAGPFLDLIGLQAGAQPGEVSSTVTWGLGLTYGPGASNYHAATGVDVIQSEYESRPSVGSSPGPVTATTDNRKCRQRLRQHIRSH